MKAICKNNSHTWRNMLTLGKEYEVLQYFKGEVVGADMIEIKCDNGQLMEYVAERFDLVNE